MHGINEIAEKIQLLGIPLHKCIMLTSDPNSDSELRGGIQQVWVDNYWEALCRKHHKTSTKHYSAPILDLEYLFKTMPTFSYSPVQELVYSLLLAEARPPLNEPARYAFLKFTTYSVGVNYTNNN